MTNATDISDDLSGVSSLYGPGTLGGWACTVVSVIINWNFIQEAHETDTLTNDFLAVLVIPLAAAVHFIFLIFDSSEVDLRKYNTLTDERLADSGPAINRHVKSTEAAFLTCAAFIMVAPYLGFMAARMCHFRRLASCIFVCFFVLLAQFPTFICSYEDIKTRSYRDLPVISRGSFCLKVMFALGGPVLLLLAWMMWRHWVYRPQGVMRVALAGPAEADDVRPVFACRKHRRPGERYESCEGCRAEAEVVRWAYSEAEMFHVGMDVLIIIFVPFLYLYTVSLAGIGRGERFAFVPRSSNRVSEADQAVALLMGAVTVAYSTWESVKVLWEGRSAGRGTMSRPKLAKRILSPYDAGDVKLLRSHIPAPGRYSDGESDVMSLQECASLGLTD